MTPYFKEWAEFLSDSLRPFYHGVFNPDKILNGLPQNSHGSSVSQTLHNLLNSAMEPARELLLRFEELKLVTQEASMDHKSTTLEVLKEKIL